MTEQLIGAQHLPVIIGELQDKNRASISERLSSQREDGQDGAVPYLDCTLDDVFLYLYEVVENATFFAWTDDLFEAMFTLLRCAQDTRITIDDVRNEIPILRQGVGSVVHNG